MQTKAILASIILGAASVQAAAAPQPEPKVEKRQDFNSIVSNALGQVSQAITAGGGVIPTNLGTQFDSLASLANSQIQQGLSFAGSLVAGNKTATATSTGTGGAQAGQTGETQMPTETSAGTATAEETPTGTESTKATGSNAGSMSQVNAILLAGAGFVGLVIAL